MRTDRRGTVVAIRIRARLMGWIAFAGVFGAFLLTHSLPVRPAVKSRLVGVLGARGFTLAYSALSLVMMTWLIVAADRAPFVFLWEPAPWQRDAALVGMLIVCLLLALSIGRPNPFSFGGLGNDQFDPARPGVIRWTRHPLLVSLALWAALHLPPNGDLAHVLMFGMFAGFALLGMGIIDRRKRRLLGEARWSALRDAVAAGPLLPRPESWSTTALRAAVGIGAFVLLLMLHPVAFGVSPLP